MKLTKNIKIMKTLAPSLTISIVIYGVLIILISGIALGFKIHPNEPNDSDLNLQEIVFEEEAYIDDIPFDTKSIAENYLLKEQYHAEFDF